jgi:lysophospholipase L1-like esterase
MISDNAIREAMAIGRKQAEAVISFRDKELKKRAAVIAAPAKPVRRFTSLEPRMMAIQQSLGPQAQDVLVAEGDSWFDYPFHDVLRILEDHHGYEVESVAHWGDRVEEMAYTGGQLEEFTRRIEKVLRNGSIPRAILLSGGGNDISGDEFGMFLNHAASAIAGLNRTVMDGVINERVKIAYVTIISKITNVCQMRIGHPLPIILHGYDHPVPDGRGFLGGWGLLPGPWLEPGFREKGFDQLQQRISIAKELIDSFNTMLNEVKSLPEFAHVHYIDLRGTLSVDAVDDKYKNDWANELHPTEGGFEKVTSKFAQVIASL